MARPLIPRLEWARGTRYLVEGTTVVAVRPLVLSGRQDGLKRRETLWTAGGNYGLVLLAALILATPAWSLAQRARALGWSLALTTLTQLGLLLTRIMHSQFSPFETQYGPFTVVPPDYSLVKRTLFIWLYAFFTVVGPGFFALLIYWGLVTLSWGRSGQPVPLGGVGRNDPCPCGSGLKAKRCCQT